MNYVNQHLETEEKIIYQTKLNSTEYSIGFAMLILGYLAIIGSLVLGGIIVLSGLIILVLSYLRIKASEFVVTDKRIIIKVGLFKKQYLETMLSDIDGIQIKQKIMNKITNSGAIIIRETKLTNNPISNVDKAFEFRNAVYSQISKM